MPDPAPYLASVYVAIWPTGFDSEGQKCLIRPVCRLCGWRGPVTVTRNYLAPEKSPEGEAARRAAASHLANSHRRHNAHR